MMQNKTCRLILAVFSIVSLAACGSSGSFGVYDNTNQLAVDATNDRLFLFEPQGTMFVLTASTRTPVGLTPLVDPDDNNTATSALLPSVVTQAAVYANGAASRIFLLGSLSSGGSLVTNLIRVLDFDGTSFTEASFSPIELSDADTTTDESDDSFADLVVDQANARVYVSDATQSEIFVLSATDGTQVAGPLPVAGEPQGMALDNGRLYVCNTSTLAAEQVVTVFNVTDASSTAIDLDASCSSLSVASNATGTAMLVRRSDAPQVLIRSVDTTTYAASTAIATTTSGYNSGLLTSGAGISSGINDTVLSIDASGLLQGYLSEQDGNLEFVTITADLSSYASQTLSVAALNLASGAILSSGGVGTQAFFVAESGSLVSVVLGSTEPDLDQ